MHARKEDRIIEELHDGRFCPGTKHVSQESISKKPINKVIFFLPPLSFFLFLIFKQFLFTINTMYNIMSTLFIRLCKLKDFY